jgi:hypothetical protein
VDASLRPLKDSRASGEAGTMARALLVPFVLAAAVASAACGSGSDGAMSHEEFVERANAICTQRIERMKAVAPPESEAVIIPALEQVAAIEQDEYEQFSALQPPTEDLPQYERLTSSVSRMLAAGDEAREALGAGDRPRAQEAFTAVQRWSRLAHAAAVALDLPACNYDV